MRISYLPPRPRHAPRRAQIPLVLSVAMIKHRLRTFYFVCLREILPSVHYNIHHPTSGNSGVVVHPGGGPVNVPFGYLCRVGYE